MQVVSVLRPTLDQYFPEQMGVRIIAEPGRYFAASAFTLVVNIIAKRTISSSDSTSSSPGNYCSSHQLSFFEICKLVSKLSCFTPRPR